MAARRTPATFDNIARVPAPRPQVLDHRYLRTGRPVVLTGLCDRAPIRRLADLRVARRGLADLPLPVTPDPIIELLQGRDHTLEGRPYVRFADHLDALLADRTRDGCIEYETPDVLVDALPDITYLDLGHPDDGWASHMFMAGEGYTTHLHFDVDMRNVVTYQVFGRKRYVLIDPAQTRKLAPGVPPQACYASALHLQNFSEDDLRGFLRYVDAWDCILEPGETLVTPAGFWHYVEYLGPALSVTLRLPRNPHVRFLATQLPTSVELQALVACYRDEDAVGRAEAAAFAELEAAAARRYPSDEARAAALDALCVELCERLDLPISHPPYHLADIERREAMTAGVDTPGPPGSAAQLGRELGDLAVVEPHARRTDVLLQVPD